MPTINQLPVLSTISSGDQLPVYSPNNGDARRTSIGSLLTFFQQSFASPTISVNLYVPSAGFNITVPTPVSEAQWMLIQPAGTLASGTVTLPLNTSVPDGTTVLITSTQEITTFAIALNGATAIYGAVTTLAAGSATEIRYYQPTNSWYALNTTLIFASGVQAWLGNPTSANLRTAMTDETGTGSLVFATSPTLVTPILGTVTSGNISACTSTSMVLTTPVIGAATGTSLTTTGKISSTGTAGVGYSTGAGGAVVQGTSRTTGVSIDKTTGSITLFSLAGTTVATTFTVTNNTVAATDVIILNQKSGTDLYDLMVTNVAAGSFNITFRTTGGSTTETPVFNFAVIKGVAT
jgi:hypothetical protein